MLAIIVLSSCGYTFVKRTVYAHTAPIVNYGQQVLNNLAANGEKWIIKCGATFDNMSRPVEFVLDTGAAKHVSQREEFMHAVVPNTM